MAKLISWSNPTLGLFITLTQDGAECGNIVVPPAGISWTQWVSAGLGGSQWVLSVSALT